MRASFSSVTTSPESLRLDLATDALSFVSLKASKARAKSSKAREASAAGSADLVSGAMLMIVRSLSLHGL